jgi:hypothetical protein
MGREKGNNKTHRRDREEHNTIDLKLNFEHFVCGGRKTGM